MSLLASRIRDSGGALIAYVTAGDPPIDQLPAILEALAEGGADVIEVGLPFSDPIADGPTIQAAAQRALDRGTRVHDVFSAIHGFFGAPLVLMGYMNTVQRAGAEQFAERCKGAGIVGAIVCDLTPDEAGPWIAAARQADLDTVFLAAPTSTDERIAMVCESARGFVYAVSRTGVTGAHANDWAQAKQLVNRIREHTATPVCVGFGVSSPADVRAVCSFADGAIVGSKLVDWLRDNWSGGQEKRQLVDIVNELKAAAQGA